MKFFSKSGVYTTLEDYDRALEEMNRAVPIMEAIIPPQYAVSIKAGMATGLAQNKRLDEARALLGELEAEFQDITNSGMLKDYYDAQGAVAYESGEFDTACEFYEKSKAIEEGFVVRYSLADAYLKAGRTEEAIALFEKILKRHDSKRIVTPTLSVRVHYLLGGAYEKTRQPDKAAEQYRRLLAAWKDSEAGTKEITEAKTRLAALQASG
jgi:pentatricopeptide repeat protein